MASLWLWDDEQGGLACRSFWSAPDVDPGQFERAKRRLVFRPGEGKPGLATARGAGPERRHPQRPRFENVYEKLGVSDRAAAVAQALRLGVLR